MQIAFGVLAVIEVVVKLTQGGICIALGVLGLPIGFGLLRLSAGWRTCCLAFLGFGLGLGPLVVLLAMAGSSPAYFEVFGVKVAEVSRVWVAVAAVPLLILLLWQVRVLVRPDIRSLFLVGSDQQGQAAEGTRAART